jgi:hypothetical protein
MPQKFGLHFNQKDFGTMASPLDLASLTDLKRWLDVAGNDDDDLLIRLVTQISRAILSHLDRPSILPTIYQEVYDGGGHQSILLRQWPVHVVASCEIDGVALPSSPGPGSGALLQGRFVLEPPEIGPPGRLQRLTLRSGPFPIGVQNIRISYVAGYQVTGEMAVVPASAPYAVTVQAPYGRFALDRGVTYADGTPLIPVASEPTAGQYRVQDGVYSFSNIEAGTTVLFTYGYVPAELSSCCIEWAAERYLYRSRIGQRSKSLGGHETIGFIVTDVPAYIRHVLQPYRRVVTP